MSRARLAALIVFLVSLVVAVAILSDAVPGLRGPGGGEWAWPYLLRPVERWWPAVVCAAGLAVTAMWWLARHPADRWPLLLVVGLTLGLQLGLVYADRPAVGAELVDRTLSKDTSGYAAVAGEIDDLNAALRAYPELMPTFDNEHARTHPPGFVAAFWLGDRALGLWPRLAQTLAAPVRLWRCTDLWVLSRGAATAAGLLVGSWLPLLAAALTPVMGWLVARRLYRGPAVVLSALLTAAIPALLVFAPTPDQFYAFLSLLSLWLLLQGMAGRRLGWLAAAGFVLSALTLLSIGNIAWAGLPAAYAVVGAWRRGWPGRDWLLGLGVLALAGLSLWLVYWLFWGVAPWSIVGAGLEQHYLLVTSQRDYLTWLARNPLDLLLFVGLGVVVGWAGLVVAALARPNWRRTDAGLLALLVAGVVLLLLLSGSTRGEVGRLWLVFMPLLAVLAAGGWSAAAGSRAVSAARPLQSTATPARPDWLVAGLIVTAQLLLVLAIGLGWRPIQAIILPVVRPEMAALPDDLTPLDVAFTAPDGAVLPLTGFAQTGDAAANDVAITLVWAAQGATFDPATVFIHVVDDAGALVAQQDGWPVGGAWPTTCWRPGEAIVDPYRIQLPDDLPPGPLALLAGAYGPDGVRLTTTSGRDSVDLGRFSVEP